MSVTVGSGAFTYRFEEGWQDVFQTPRPAFVRSLQKFVKVPAIES